MSPGSGESFSVLASYLEQFVLPLQEWDFRKDGTDGGLNRWTDLIPAQKFNRWILSGYWVEQPGAATDAIFCPKQYRNIVLEDFFEDQVAPAMVILLGPENFLRFLVMEKQGAALGLQPRFALADVPEFHIEGQRVVRPFLSVFEEGHAPDNKPLDGWVQTPYCL